MYGYLGRERGSSEWLRKRTYLESNSARFRNASRRSSLITSRTSWERVISGGYSNEKGEKGGYTMGRRLDYNDHKFDVFGTDNGSVQCRERERVCVNVEETKNK